MGISKGTLLNYTSKKYLPLIKIISFIHSLHDNVIYREREKENRSVIILYNIKRRRYLIKDTVPIHWGQFFVEIVRS